MGDIQKHFSCRSIDQDVILGLLHMMWKYHLLYSTQCANEQADMERFQVDETKENMNTREI